MSDQSIINVLYDNHEFMNIMNEYKQRVIAYFTKYYDIFKDAITKSATHEPLQETINNINHQISMYGDVYAHMSIDDYVQRMQKEIVRQTNWHINRLYAISLGYDESLTSKDLHNRRIIASEEYSLCSIFHKCYESVMNRINEIAQLRVDAAFNKLIHSITKQIQKHDIEMKSFRIKYIDETPKGFSGIFEINNNINIHTNCIEAGGYNIQCFHYRYTSKLQK